MQQRGREAWAKWQGLISEQGGSGKSIAAFCRDRNVPVSQFFSWQRRLRQAARPAFVEVQVVEAMPSPPASGRALEVALAGGRRVFVAPGFDADHLRAVVAALETRP